MSKKPRHIWTAAEIEEHQRCHGFKPPVSPKESSGGRSAVPSQPEGNVATGLAKLVKLRMNRTEAEYGLILEALKRKGEIVDYRFEGLTLRLADDCRYTPDFFIVASVMPLVIRFVEIKGRKIWDDAKVKFRVAKEGNKWAEWEMQQKIEGVWHRIL